MKIFKRKLVKKDNKDREWLSVAVDEKDVEIKEVIWRDFSDEYKKNDTNK